MEEAFWIAVGEVLEQLAIPYRAMEFPDGTMYFCKLPDGAMFNLFAGSSGLIRLWKFVSELPEGIGGIGFGCRDAAYPHTAVRLEASEEGELSLCLEQTLSPDDPELEERVAKLVQTYGRLFPAGKY